MIVADCIARLEVLAPPALAETWDNVGLLIGDPAAQVDRVMTCLTLTADVAREAIDAEAQLIVTHHPVLFRPVQRLTSGSAEGRVLLEIIRAGIAVYSPHTSYDSAPSGINQQLAEALGLIEICSLRPNPSDNAAAAGGLPGAGRQGRLPAAVSVSEFITEVRRTLRASSIHFVGEHDRRVERVGIACGSGGEFLRDAARAGCDVFLTGEARFHTCLDARELNIALVLAGHYATERPAVESLAVRLQREWGVEAWASRCESDPVQGSFP